MNRSRYVAVMSGRVRPANHSCDLRRLGRPAELKVISIEKRRTRVGSWMSGSFEAPREPEPHAARQRGVADRAAHPLVEQVVDHHAETRLAVGTPVEGQRSL